MHRPAAWRLDAWRWDAQLLCARADWPWLEQERAGMLCGGLECSALLVLAVVIACALELACTVALSILSGWICAFPPFSRFASLFPDSKRP